jgi:hypothetical protein
MLTYNQNGTSRGIASIVFSKPDTAAKAAKDLNGLLVDGRPMKVSVTPQFFIYVNSSLMLNRLRWLLMPPMLPQSPPPSRLATVSRMYMLIGV